MVSVFWQWAMWRYAARDYTVDGVSGGVVVRPSRPAYRRILNELTARTRKARYKPPPMEACEETTVPIRLHSVGSELLVWTARYRNLIVDFSVTQRVRGEEGWHEIASVYVDQGHTLFEQHFRASGVSSRRRSLVEIPVRQGWRVVDGAYLPAVRMMQDDWHDNLRRWNGDSA